MATSELFVYRKEACNLNPLVIDEYEDARAFQVSYFSVNISEYLAEKIGWCRPAIFSIIK